MTTGVTAVSGGVFHTLALVNGGVRAWGTDVQGELGNGDPAGADQGTPVQVTGLTSGVTAIDAGASHSLALVGGGVRAWGANFSGQLGDGSTTSRTAPVTITIDGSTTGVTAISGGVNHSLAIQNGRAFAWGGNGNGQIGDGSTTQRNTAVGLTINGSTSGVTVVSAGGRGSTGFSLAVQGGAAYAWGANGNGQLGDSSTTQRTAPTPMAVLTAGVTALSAGGAHGLAIMNGEVYAWGSNSDGQIGASGVTVGSNQTTPILVTGGTLPDDFVAVEAGDSSSYALTASGRLFVWGNNDNGQLGVGGGDRSVPVELLAGTNLRWSFIGAGNAHFVLVATPEPAGVLGLAAVAVAGLAGVRRRLRRQPTEG